MSITSELGKVRAEITRLQKQERRYRELLATLKINAKRSPDLPLWVAVAKLRELGLVPKEGAS